MPTYYIRSTDGNNADDGSTWDLAEADLHTPTWAAGDTLYVSDNHAQNSTTAAITIASAGTNASPTKIICVDDSAEPPTAVATTGTVTTTGNYAITITGSVYCYGLTFVSGAALTVNGSNADQTGVYKNCSFQTTNTGTGGALQFGGANNQNMSIRLENCTWKFGNSANTNTNGGCVLTVNGGSVVSGTANITNFMRLNTERSNCQVFISGFDFSNLASTLNIFLANGAGSGYGIIRNCKLPGSWSGSLINGTIEGMGQRVEMHNCDSGDTNYRMWVEDYAGSIKSETTIVKSSGASDGTTPISWKMVSSANAEYPTILLYSPEIVKWNDTTGSSKSVTVEIVHDSAGAGGGSDFQNDEIWLEVQYLGTSGFPLSSFILDAKADVLATAADHANSSVTWTTTGLSTPVKQYLTVSFTPQEKGYIHARVVLAKASKTVYVDPMLTVA